MPRMSKKGKPAATALPPGFKTANVSGDFATVHDFDAIPVLQGTCTKIENVKTKNGKQLFMSVKKPDGILAGVWHSYMLDGLFKQKPIRREVFIQLTGYQKIKGRKQPMKLFACGVK